MNFLNLEMGSLSTSTLSPMDSVGAIRLFPSAPRWLTEILESSFKLFERAALADPLQPEGDFHFKQLADCVPQIVWTAKRGEAVDYFNRRWYEFTGLPCGELNWRPILHPDDLPRCLEVWDRAERNGNEYEVEYRIRGVDGGYRWFLARALPIRDSRGEAVRWFGTCTDIDEQKRAAEALRLSQERLQMALETAQMTTWEFDILRSRAHYSENFLRLLGVQSVGIEPDLRRLLDCVHSDDRPALDLALKKIISGEEDRLAHEYRVIWADGAIHWLSLRAKLIRTESGEPSLILGALINVDPLKEREGRLERVLRTHEDFLGVAGHELRNPITSLVLFVDLMNRLITTGGFESISQEHWRHLLDTSQRQLRNLAGLVDDLMDVSRIQNGKLTLRLERVDLSLLVRESVENLSALMDRAGCALDLRLEGEVVGVWDRRRIGQVVTNLLSNAIKYGAGSAITVTVQKQENSAEIQIQDRGIGIDPMHQSRIFDRFERVTEGGEIGGLGLGLFISKEIVQQHRGSIEVRSALNEGATFRICLPISG